MKTTEQIINYLKIHKLMDAYARKCEANEVDPIAVIKGEGVSCIRCGFVWLATPEEREQWSYENERFSKWFLSDTTPLKVIHHKGGAVTLTGVHANPSLAGVHFANAEQAREWLAKNTEYEVDYDKLMGLNS